MMSIAKQELAAPSEWWNAA